jgi:hypothetical protein
MRSKRDFIMAQLSRYCRQAVNRKKNAPQRYFS